MTELARQFWESLGNRAPSISDSVISLMVPILFLLTPPRRLSESDSRNFFEISLIKYFLVSESKLELATFEYAWFNLRMSKTCSSVCEFLGASASLFPSVLIPFGEGASMKALCTGRDSRMS